MTFDALTEAEEKAKLVELTAKLNNIKASQKKYYHKKKDVICKKNRDSYNENKTQILARRRELYNEGTYRKEKRRAAYLKHKAAKAEVVA